MDRRQQTPSTSFCSPAGWGGRVLCFYRDRIYLVLLIFLAVCSFLHMAAITVLMPDDQSGNLSLLVRRRVAMNWPENATIPDSLPSTAKTPSSEVVETKSNEIATKDDDPRDVQLPRGCVSRRGGKCILQRCHNNDDHGAPGDDDSIVLGYAGRFVERDDTVGHEHAVMEVGGGNSWDSGCAISHKHRFVFLHNLKSGGTTIKHFLKKALCGENGDHNCDKNVLDTIACSTAMRNYGNYFIWSFVRNPFSRMYSMYSMTEGYPRTKSQLRPMDNSFENFVLKPSQRNKYTFMSPSHYIPQRSFLFDGNNCPSADFLGRLDHFNNDLNILLDYLNIPELVAYVMENNGVEQLNTWGKNRKADSLNGDLRNTYSRTDVVSEVVRTYRGDFELLGYTASMEEIPKFR